ATPPCVLDERHSETLLEQPPGSRHIDAKRAEVTITPTPLGLGLDRLDKSTDDFWHEIGMRERSAALARTIGGVKRVLGCREELAVLEPGLARRARRPAE